MYKVGEAFKDNRILLLQTALSVAVRVMSALAGFLVSIFLGQYLGAEQAGYYFLALSVIVFLSAFSRFGLDDTVLRIVGAAMPVKDHGGARSALFKACILISLISLFVGGLLFWFSDFISSMVFNKPGLAPVLEAFAPGVLFTSLFVILGMALQGARKIVASVFTVNIAVNLFVVVIMFFLGVDTAESASIAYSISAGLAALSGLWLICPLLRGGSGYVTFSELIKSCVPLWVVVIMQQTVLWSGQLIAGAWVDTHEIAQLAVAQRTSLLVTFIFLAVNLVVAPKFAELHKQGDAVELRRLSFTSVKIMVVFALPIVILMLSFSGFLMGLFGDTFREGYYLLEVLVVGQFVCVASGPVNYLLTMSGHERDLRNAVLVSGPMAVFLSVVLVPSFGVLGAAVATSIAIASQSLMAAWWVRRRLGFNVFSAWVH